MNSDAWADGKGQFMTAVSANSVYRLLGAKGLESTIYPRIDTGLMSGGLPSGSRVKGTLRHPTGLFSSHLQGVTLTLGDRP